MHTLVSRQREGRITRAQQISNSLSAVGVDNAYQKARNIADMRRLGAPILPKCSLMRASFEI